MPVGTRESDLLARRETIKYLYVHYSTKGKEMKEIIMIIDDVEFPYGKYPYNTAEERRCTDIIASEVARERRCKVYLKEVPEDDKSR